MNEMTMYWFTRLDHFHDVVPGFVILAALCAIIFIIYNAGVEEGVFSNKFKIPINLFLSTVFIFNMTISFVIALFVPTTTEIAAIYVVPRILNNEKIKDISDSSLELADQWLKTQIENAKKNSTQNK